jgi:hypothetical protein
MLYPIYYLIFLHSICIQLFYSYYFCVARDHIYYRSWFAGISYRHIFSCRGYSLSKGMGRWTWMVRLSWPTWILSWPLESELNQQNILIRKGEGMICAKNTHKYSANDEPLWYNIFITKNLNLYRTTKLLMAIDTPLCLTEYIHNMTNFSLINYFCWNYGHLPFILS